MPITTGFEDEVLEELEAAREPVNQDRFVEELESQGFERGEALRTIRSLMEQDRVSYTVSWDLRIVE